MSYMQTSRTENIILMVRFSTLSTVLQNMPLPPPPKILSVGVSVTDKKHHMFWKVLEFPVDLIPPVDPD